MERTLIRARVRMGAFDLSFPLSLFGDRRNAGIGVAVKAVLELQVERFQRLVSKLSLKRGTALDSAVEEIYGEPLTTLDGSAGLEWRFLR